MFLCKDEPGRIVRFIYHLADGREVLLLDNYYIDISQVNSWYAIPYIFECTAPFGAELLQVYASNEKFAPLSIRLMDGYRVIQERDNDIDSTALSLSTRGLRTKPQDWLVEKYLWITTVGK